ncbi:DUF3558 domain-containing protein [Amycolatopsis sp. RTGN1]|uniref:DUF3558 domain-containing protein n=1 Tax=Amycolatopsis ponsaeliensis TaxID=2992142 RepID=UPI00255179F0|nr:DUF3558 domain-containing protein [Amycolatopsis sp. RTGN1]
MRVRVLPTIAAALLGASLLTACGPSEPKRILAEPPTPAQTGPALPFTPVQDPVDLAKFDSDPCSLLTREQVAAVVEDPPDNVRPGKSVTAGSAGCAWNTWYSPLVSVLKQLKEPKTLEEFKNLPRRESGAMDPWTETSVAGLPAAVFHEARGPEECDVAVGVTDTDLLIFSYHGSGTHSTYWESDRCGGVLKTAEYVLGNLRKG